VSRAEQKERTRRAILDAALQLTAETGLAALSLRQVAKEVGIVPTAFYRHFDSIDALGLALVDESFASLREVLRDVRRGRPAPREIISTSVGILAQHVEEQREHFGFIARERAAGPPLVRHAVRHQLDLFERELATDLARLSGPRWSSEDLQVVSALIVNVMVATVGDLLADEPRDAVTARTEKQLRMLVVGVLRWRSDYED
jgi:AcrR family transcriptional regulator